MPALRISYAIAKPVMVQPVNELTAPASHQSNAPEMEARTKEVL